MVRGALLSIAALALALLSPLQAQAMTGAYAALGDSVAAGAGLTGGTAPCYQSTQSYGYIVSQTTGLPVHHLACTGAKADEGLYGAQERDGYVLPAQVDQAFSGGTPSLMTITIGANDARWTQFIRQCYYIRCGYDIDTARYAAYLADLKLELNVTLARIHTLSSGSPPPIIVTGYYAPLTSATCADTAGLTTTETSWLNSRTAGLNDAIRGTVEKYSYAHFAPVNFTGHELCTVDPWIQGPNGAMPFHPTAAGQASIAATVLATYNSLNTSPHELSYREQILNWVEKHSYW